MAAGALHTAGGEDMAEEPLVRTAAASRDSDVLQEGCQTGRPIPADTERAASQAPERSAPASAAPTSSSATGDSSQIVLAPAVGQEAAERTGVWSKPDSDKHRTSSGSSSDVDAARKQSAAALNRDDEPVSQEESNLFVGDLARGLSEEELQAAFAQFGRVVTVNIKRDRNTGKNLGYGFVRMGTHEEAVTAKDSMHRAELRGRRVRVGWAQKNTSLFCGALPEDTTNQQLRALFGQFGPLDEEHTNVVRAGRYGLVKFRYRLHAEQARKQLNGATVLGRHPLRVEWNNIAANSIGLNNTKSAAARLTQANPTGLSVASGVQVVLQGYISLSTQQLEETVLELFSAYGPLADLLMPRAESRGLKKSDAGGGSGSHDGGHDGALTADAATGSTSKETSETGSSSSMFDASASRGSGSIAASQHLPEGGKLYQCTVRFPTTPAGHARAAAALTALDGTTTSNGLKVSCTLAKSDYRMGPGVTAAVAATMARNSLAAAYASSAVVQQHQAAAAAAAAAAAPVTSRSGPALMWQQQQQQQSQAANQMQQQLEQLAISSQGRPQQLAQAQQLQQQRAPFDGSNAGVGRDEGGVKGTQGPVQVMATPQASRPAGSSSWQLQQQQQQQQQQQMMVLRQQQAHMYAQQAYQYPYIMPGGMGYGATAEGMTGGDGQSQTSAYYMPYMPMQMGMPMTMAQQLQQQAYNVNGAWYPAAQYGQGPGVPMAMVPQQHAYYPQGLKEPTAQVTRTQQSHGGMQQHKRIDSSSNSNAAGANDAGAYGGRK
eukprot:TRINITY_DN821_c0_g1_i1.p1 TRINITY_DN821_c0_g1~~TRINITY_DN821_c0_g1_i1.p1  ORF type:complete len:775 (+),score=200.61 TRINITY_DN821_c0_g1_i1:165-2489(+)